MYIKDRTQDIVLPIYGPRYTPVLLVPVAPVSAATPR